ncbi:STT3 domain-containing protein [Sulfurimonas sp. C5]|uniref:STT3 domain-containing protein n=1 Tax=Sulfurimonas sp. C5 TaxID=3036947 RepID=UPI002454A6DF|nr:STT3 domain-containing protein [Sulfurimonas sp. C5]MDH4943492.1 STT3 domain-containing protein [Sulfurimonas sp. C5]
MIKYTTFQSTGKNLNSLTRETKLTIFYILLAFIFSVSMRMIWVYQFNDFTPFKYNDQFMINTNDGYLWAEGARDILGNTVYREGIDQTPVTSAPSILTALFAKVLPFSFESIIFYLPVFLSSLIVIPIILIAKLLKNLEMGLIAAMLASIAWSYYNRTMAGYYDTDMLNIVLPMFLLWSIIWAVKTNQNIYLFLTALDILLYRLWYPQSYSLEFAFFGLILAYTLLFDRKNIFNYKLLAIMMFAMMGLDGYTRLALVAISYYIFTQEKFNKYGYYLLGIAVITFFVTGGFNPIWMQLKGYVFSESVSVEQEGLGLHFFTVMQTVREAGKIPFEMFANRISGHTLVFIISFIGYLYLLFKHRIMLLSLPLVGLGFLAYIGGLRFTIYAVPILAFGVAFLITEIAAKLPTTKLKFLAMIALTLVMLYPNYKHIDSYKIPTVFNNDEVDVLKQLSQIATPNDYTVAWWDYGYPIRYYANTQTLIDGGKHSGAVNFPVSFILTHPQDVAAKMARLDVEYTEKNLMRNKKIKDGELEGNVSTISNIEQMTRDYGFKDTNQFLASLKQDIKLPVQTTDIYLYLPFRMTNIYPTITYFSNLNLMNGVKYQDPFFYMSRNFQEIGNKIVLGENIFLDKSNLSITIGNKSVPIRRFVRTAYSQDKKLHVQSQLVNFTSNMNLIYLASYNVFIVLDEATYNSTFVQLFILENYDKELYDMVINTPGAKVFKLKI